MIVRHITASTADELMEQREQNQACLGYAESRQKKTEGQKIKQLYETAFPEDEQISWDDLMRLVKEIPLDFFRVICYARRALVYVDFFPISLLNSQA